MIFFDGYKIDKPGYDFGGRLGGIKRFVEFRGDIYAAEKDDTLTNERCSEPYLKIIDLTAGKEFCKGHIQPDSIGNVWYCEYGSGVFQPFYNYVFY